jgi:hypothetical protein
MDDGRSWREGGPSGPGSGAPTGDVANMHTTPLMPYDEPSPNSNPRATQGPVHNRIVAGPNSNPRLTLGAQNSNPEWPTPAGLPASGGTAGPAPQPPLNLSVPTPPTTLGETGLELVLLEELTLKHIVASGLITGGDLAKRLHLPLGGVVEEAINSLRRDALVDLQSATQTVLGLAGMRIRATERGAQVERLAREKNGYIGPAPVPLGDFERILRQQSMSGRGVNRANVRRGLAHLVLSHETVDRVGAGLESGGPILLHGNEGNGKTAIVASFPRILPGAVLVPHAVVIDGQVMRVLDPSVHRPINLDSTALGVKMDERWVVCHTPYARATVELQLRHLELHFNQTHRYYDCPLQLKAAGGVLLLDDLGMQQGRVEDMVYRCLEPTYRGIDYLTTVAGQQIAFPFTPLLVFATSRAPADILGNALLRQIPCKITVPDPTRDQYAELLRRACSVAGVEFSQSGVEYILERCYARTGRALRASHPSQLVRLITGAARYFDTPAQLEPQLIDVAADLYFS